MGACALFDYVRLEGWGESDLSFSSHHGGFWVDLRISTNVRVAAIGKGGCGLGLDQDCMGTSPGSFLHAVRGHRGGRNKVVLLQKQQPRGSPDSQGN